MNSNDFWKKVQEMDEIYEEEERMERQNAGTFEEEECKHVITATIEGIFVCEECGVIFGPVLDSDFALSTNKNGVRMYERRKYFRDLMNRVSGLSFKESKSNINIADMPDTIRGIRKYIRKHKLHKLNDYYYWRIKNNVKQLILRADMIEWEDEFRKLRKNTQRDFLYEKFSNITKYNIFAPLFQRKTPSQTPKQDC
jgi:hypothetical protein